MKMISILLFVTFHCLAFSQSAKKLNQQLWEELDAEDQQQDSAHAIFKQSKRTCDSVRHRMTEKIIAVSGEEQEIKRLIADFSEMSGQLKVLGVNSNNLITPKNDSIPDFKKVIEPLRESFISEAKFVSVTKSFYFEEDIELKELNVLLSEKIQEFRDGSKTNSIRREKMEANAKQQTVFFPILDSLSRVYQGIGNQLRSEGEVLRAKLDKLRTNYIQKGPNGFLEAYKKVFPDAFPSPQDELNERSGTVTTSGDVERYDALLESVEAAPKEPEPEIYEWVEERPVFPGGRDKMVEFISNNLHYPENKKEAAISGSVTVKFVVSKKGELSEITVWKGIPGCKECDLEAIRVVKMMPNWTVPIHEGKAVRCYSRVNIPFEMK